MSRCLALLALPALATTAACTDEPTASLPPDVTSGTYHHYVQTGWRLPVTGTEVQALGFDHDDDGVVENQVGNAIAFLAGLGLDLVGGSTAAFAAGDLVVLHSVRADQLGDDPSVAWRILAGAADAPPRFDGSDALRVTGEDGELFGTLRGGRADLAWGYVALPVPFFPDQPPLILPLAEARLVADLTADGCAGRLGGAILAEDFASTLTRLATQAITHIERRPDHPFTTSARQVFDRNHDGRIDVAEIVESDVIDILLRPDLDLDGDGQLDGLSFAVGFDCVPAGFTALGEQP